MHVGSRDHASHDQKLTTKKEKAITYSLCNIVAHLKTRKKYICLFLITYGILEKYISYNYEQHHKNTPTLTVGLSMTIQLCYKKK